jgi:hypothetical protein
MSAPIKIVDTNIVLVANGQHQDASCDCVKACTLALQAIMEKGRIAIDDGYEILTEYQNKTTPGRGKRPGDTFVKWVLRNNCNAQRCDNVHLKKNRAGKYEIFPNDPELLNFDDPDRKFVAVALGHSQHPPILQGTDCKWLDWEQVLKRHGVAIEFICLADIQKFHRKKFPAA